MKEEETISEDNTYLMGIMSVEQFTELSIFSTELDFNKRP